MEVKMLKVIKRFLLRNYIVITIVLALFYNIWNLFLY